jgi:hypothetical protein
MWQTKENNTIMIIAKEQYKQIAAAIAAKQEHPR